MIEQRDGWGIKHKIGCTQPVRLEGEKYMNVQKGNGDGFG